MPAANDSEKAQAGNVARRAPILIEVVVAASKLALLAASSAVALVTWLADGSPLLAVLRAGLMLLVLSGLLWALNYLLAEGVLSAHAPAAKARGAQAAPPQPTIEVEA